MLDLADIADFWTLPFLEIDRIWTLSFLEIDAITKLKRALGADASEVLETAEADKLIEELTDASAEADLAWQCL